MSLTAGQDHRVIAAKHRFADLRNAGGKFKLPTRSEWSPVDEMGVLALEDRALAETLALQAKGLWPPKCCFNAHTELANIREYAAWLDAGCPRRV